MNSRLMTGQPSEFASALEQKFFWWEPVGAQIRSEDRILAQAMNFASFAEVRELEKVLGVDRLAQVMLDAEPGWLSDRSWEFWRGRLALATGRKVPAEPPRRSFDAAGL